jgi:diadenosine tetraphosphatase ApaH/serine/threonine PP2A family protein phosphatase
MARIAFLSDIHANREAFEACLTDAARRGADRLVILGDLVGYGADPGWVVAKARELASTGAVILKGNHDEAAVVDRGGMNSDAAAAAAWTRGVLDDADKAFLKALPLEAEEEDRLYVHADATDPAAWHYVTDADAARRSIAATEARIVLCGHVHVPALYNLTAAAKLVPFRPVTDVSVPLIRPRRWHAVLGAVGQPRDGDPAAAWSMLDEEANELTLHRIPYDVAAAAGKIRAAGLPEALAIRLHRGR